MEKLVSSILKIFTILTIIIILNSFFFLCGNEDRKWDIKHRKRKLEHYSRRLSERLLENFTEGQSSSRLMNEDGISIIDIEKDFNNLCELESVDAFCDLKKNGHLLLTTLIEEILVNDSDEVIKALNEFNRMIGEEIYQEATFLDRRIYALYNITKAKVSGFRHTLERDALLELCSLSTKTRLFQHYNIENLKYIFSKVRYLNRFHYDTISVYLDDLTSLKRRLDYFMGEIFPKTLNMIKVVTVDNNNVFPLNFIIDTLRFPNIGNAMTGIKRVQDNIFSSLFFLMAQENSIHELNVNTLDSYLRSIDDHLSSMDTFITKNTFKLMKRLCKDLKGPLQSILALFLYIFKIAATNHVVTYNEEIYAHNFLQTRESLKENLRKIHELSKNLLTNKKQKFTERIYSLFKIDVTKPQFNILAQQLSKSENFKSIMKIMKQLVTAVFFKKRLSNENNILIEMIESKKKTKLYKKLISHNSPPLPKYYLPAEVYNEFRQSFIKEIELSDYVLYIYESKKSKKAKLEFIKSEMNKYSLYRGLMDLLVENKEKLFLINTSLNPLSKNKNMLKGAHVLHCNSYAGALKEGNEQNIGDMHEISKQNIMDDEKKKDPSSLKPDDNTYLGNMYMILFLLNLINIDHFL